MGSWVRLGALLVGFPPDNQKEKSIGGTRPRGYLNVSVDRSNVTVVLPSGAPPGDVASAVSVRTPLLALTKDRGPAAALSVKRPIRLKRWSGALDSPA